jgi:DNA-binding transcriptional ArsR family regulator
MKQLARFFKALGDDTRLQLVVLLAQQETGRAMCVGRLAEQLGVTTSNVSQHLRVLKDLGLVRAERRRYRIHYFLDRERLAAYQALVREHLGEGFVLVHARSDSGMARDVTEHPCTAAEQEQAG